MRDIRISKTLEEKRMRRPGVKNPVGKKAFSVKDLGSRVFASGREEVAGSVWNFLLLFLMGFGVFGILIAEISNLQVVQGQEMLSKSQNNHIRVKSVPSLRGVIFDRNGKKIVENAPSMNVYLTIESYLDEIGEVDTEKLLTSTDTLEGILGDGWKSQSADGEIVYTSIAEKIYSAHETSPYFSEILIATDIDNEIAIELKASAENLPGVYIDDGSKRYYPIKESLSHILGYTGEVSAEDLEVLDYASATDVVGKSGIERQYDEILKGVNGKLAWEVDAVGKTISEEEYLIEEPKTGENLYLTIDADIQEALYSIVEDGVKEYDANGGAGVIEDVRTGEIVALTTYPSYDNNLFVGGISYKDYAKLLKNGQNPLLNRTIAAQVPPGSTFKTLVATAALDSGAINKNTKYVSRAGYTFSSGAPFQEYHGHSYGVLNVVDAISVSSNIFFCETVRHWDYNELVPYLERFGIGQYTNIDIPGEMPGRLPSPENKIKLANTTSPWLDAVWYPEGDSCNSVIGQGITLVTPLQMANWMAAIANEGTLNTPHLAKKFVNEDGEESVLEYDSLRTNVASEEAIEITKEGMWSAVNGSRRSIPLLSGMKFEIAAKTGTAEFGALNEKGEYEHTHAWVGGFFPYNAPKYSFSIFLEDGGESYNAVNVMREMILWLIKNEYF